MTESLEDRFQNLHEFVTQARTNLNRNNWDYLIGGSETETTLARNRLALDAIGFRPRVLRDVSNVDCSRTFFGKKLRIPVLCAPVGSLQVFDPDGGATVAAATRDFGNGMILSSVAHPGLDKTAEASGDGVQDLPALCARRRRLGRRPCPPRHRPGLRRLLPDRRHRQLQPARARHRQAPPAPPASASTTPASIRRSSTGATSSGSRRISTSRSF